MMKTSIIFLLLLPFLLSSCGEPKSENSSQNLFAAVKPVESKTSQGEYTVNLGMLTNQEKSENNIPAKFLDKNITLVRGEVVKRSESNMTWNGKVKGEEFSNVTFTIVDGFLQGQININADTYTVSPKKDGNYLVVKVDKSKAIKGGNDVVVPPIIEDMSKSP
ncbi:MAG: hypothetical protein HQK84_09305 [Nitrospinae bacterium]|nr:hypothetical protein [Nitrospinota bacterium]